MPSKHGQTYSGDTFEGGCRRLRKATLADFLNPEPRCLMPDRLPGEKKFIMRGLFLLIVLGVVVFLFYGRRGIDAPKDARVVERVLLTTGYCKCSACCGWRRNWYGLPVYSYGPNKGGRKMVGITAGGTKARPGTIAADAARFPFGVVMYIDGYGFGRVEDRGLGIKGDHIDLFFRTHREAMRWGMKRIRVRIWLPTKTNTRQHTSSFQQLLKY